MNDRELLEFAAKAAGYPHTKWDEHGWFYVCGLEGDWLGPSDFELWNPLKDDGDALRLALQLDIVVWEFSQYDRAMVEVRYGAARGEYWGKGGDRFEDTRRVIVHAAAEIGKAMK